MLNIYILSINNKDTMKTLECTKCYGTGIIKEKDGTVHTCFDCLINGRFEQHGEPKDTDIRW